VFRLFVDGGAGRRFFGFYPGTSAAHSHYPLANAVKLSGCPASSILLDFIQRLLLLFIRINTPARALLACGFVIFCSPGAGCDARSVRQSL
jgi:hypothetical protein